MQVIDATEQEAASDTDNPGRIPAPTCWPACAHQPLRTRRLRAGARIVNIDASQHGMLATNATSP